MNKMTEFNRWAVELFTVLFAVVPTLLIGQCPPGPLGTGQFLDKPSGCATNGLDINFTPQYNQLEDNSVIVISWGDGTPDENINVGSTGRQSGISYNTPVPHTYTEANTTGGCLYTITAHVESPGGCYTQEETTVEADIIIWNTDNFGDNNSDIAINPMLYEVCVGSSATVQFRDVSPWNCTDTDLTVQSLNQQPRWTQWEYGVFNDITGTVEIAGADQSPYPFTGAAVDHLALPVLNPQSPGNRSLEVFVPHTAQVGEEFHVRLHNWNQCNPYRDASGTLTGNAPVSQDAIIRVIDVPKPAVNTSDAGPFCIGERIRFTYSGTSGAGYRYLWDFGDGHTSTRKNPTHTFTTKGTFHVTVEVSLNQPNLECNAITSPAFEVVIDPTPVPEMMVLRDHVVMTDLEFCISSEEKTFKFAVDSTQSLIPNPSQTTYEWRFYTRNSYTEVAETIVNPPDTIQRSFHSPGTYFFQLEVQDLLTNCGFVREDTLTIYDNPLAGFAVSEVCEGERTAFSAIVDGVAGIPEQVNGDRILYWDWDFSYDSVFNRDLRRSNNENFLWFLDGNPVVDGIEPLGSIQGNYRVALRVTTETGGCENLLVKEVTVNPKPTATFEISPVGPLCSGEIVTFTNTSTQPEEISILGNTAYKLIFQNVADDTRDTINFHGTPLEYSFDNTTSVSIDYELSLLAISPDPELCQHVSDPIMLTIDPGSQAAFSDPQYDPLLANCSPWSSTFLVDQAVVDQDPDAYTWTIEDMNGILSGFPLIKTKGEADFHLLDYTVVNDLPIVQNYKIRLDVEKNGICFAGAEEVIRISPSPAATFSVQVIDSCDFKTLIPEADQSGLADYSWLFTPLPNSQELSGSQAEVRFQRPGKAGDLAVQISLQTQNLAGCLSDPEIHHETVEGRPASITALFTTDRDTLIIPETTFQITNASTGEINSYSWGFGDGVEFTGQNPLEHTYHTYGTYTIKLIASNDFCAGQYQKEVVILPTAPIVDFEADNVTGCRPLTVQFTNLSQFTEEDRYEWDFGDGIGTSGQVSPSYTYYEAGQYTVSLKGKNILGEEDLEVKQFLITVHELPEARFEARPKVVSIPDKPVYFSNFSTGADSFHWDFGDGNSSQEEKPVHYYKETGFYTVQLIARNLFGCADTLILVNALEAREGGDIKAPNAFTPDPSGPSGGVHGEGSGHNDIFLPFTESVEKFSMLIYNKWGELMFESRNKNMGWDGYYQGKLCPTDVYIYRLDIRYVTGKEIVKIGDVTLLR